MIVLTGDTHRDFERIFDFCTEQGLTEDDVLVILGDAGINYYLDESDEMLKRELSELPVTLFCIHGNHEERPFNIDTYEEQEWRGSVVYAEPEFPTLLFAKDGEIYDFDGRKAVVLGGAYSVDKFYRLQNGAPWFPDEQPDDSIKSHAEAQLNKARWRVDYVFSHTAPLPYEPRHAFLPGLDQSAVDKSTEEWLGEIEQRLDYGKWYCGHYHIDDQEGPVRILWEEFIELDTGGLWDE